MSAHLLQTSSWRHLSACYDDYFSEIKCQFSLVWPYICISMVLLNIDLDYRAVRWKVRWLQVVCPLWIHQCWIFCSMIIYTVKANSHVQFLYIDVYMYCKIDEGTRILLGFFFIKLLFLLSVFLQILELLNLHVWKFHVLLLFVFRNWRTLFFTTNVCMFLLSFLAILYYVAQFYYEFVKLMLWLSVSW